jgi:ABC-type Fe3+/spermidine/putrescine transport system ATPase subunit
MTLIKVTNVSKQVDGDLILKNISFSQKKLQKIAVAGETGSGKTTLLKIIAGLVQPDSGEVKFQNKSIKGPDEKLVPGHPGCLAIPALHISHRISSWQNF